MYVYDHHLKRTTNKFQSYPAISFSTRKFFFCWLSHEIRLSDSG